MQNQKFSSLISLGLVFSLGLLSSCDFNSSEGASDTKEDFTEESILCVEKINEFRATEGLEPLKHWVEGDDCASVSAKSDSQSGKAHGSFQECGEWAQNECPGWPSLDAVLDGCLQQMWDEKKLGPDVDFQQNGHYLNMSSTKYTEVACGFYRTQDSTIWHVQNFR